MQKEETRFVFFEVRNRMLSEICRDFKIKVGEVTFSDFVSENNIGYIAAKHIVMYIRRFLITWEPQVNSVCPVGLRR